MKHQILSVLLALLSLTAPSWATVIYVSGDQTGTWSADTVIVTAEVRVPPGQSLTIQPGVEVLFQVYCKLIVDNAATLHAVGTAADSIRFDVLPPDTAWHGIRFLSASDSSRLEYCHLTHGYATGSGADCNGGAIYCSSSSPTIGHNAIIENSATQYGGGIHCDNSSPAISGNIINENSGGWGGGISCTTNSNPSISGNTISGNAAWGGGISCEYSSPSISGNTISENSGGGIGCTEASPIISGNTIIENIFGWGIGCGGGSPTISGNTISDNSTPGNGGGIGCDFCSAIISGNTISGNSAAGGGGGIYCYYCSPNISGNTISENSSGLQGGGILCEYGSPSIISNTISGNSFGGISCWNNSSPSIGGNTIRQNSGSGIQCDGSNPSISNNTISDNEGVEGAGIRIYNASPIISGNTISGNSGSYGGAICCTGGSPTISSNTLSGNVAIFGGGIYCHTSLPTMVNCILWGNSAQQIYVYSGSPQVNYSDVQGGCTGTGNIDLDPLFVDPANGDYHLQSTVGSYHGGFWLPDSLYSPCIDAGDPSSPFALEPMPNGGRINMGFEGNTAEASLSTNTWVSPSTADLPRKFCIHTPHPNPFNANTVLSYQLPLAGHVSLRIFDTAGRLVTTLVDGWRNSGTHEVAFDGSRLASGVYVYRLEASGSGTSPTTVTGKLVLMK